jgi:predicted amidohydrolase
MDLVAVQPYVELADYLAEERFAAHLDRLADRVEALRRSPEAVVVFPEDIGTFLALLAAPPEVRSASTLDHAFGLIGRRAWAPLLATMARLRTRSLRRAFFHWAAPTVYGAWYRTFARLARRLDAVVVAGSALLPDNALGYTSDRFQSRGGPVYNLSLTFGPDGRVRAVTKKRNLVPTQEDVLDLTPGTAPLPDPVPVGALRLGTAICYDAFVRPHTDREPGFTPLVPLLAARGVDLVAQPAANPWPWEEPWVFAGPGDHRRRCQQWEEESLPAAMQAETRIRAGITAHLLARLFDVRFEGPSAIYIRDGDHVRAVAVAPRADAHPEAETVVAYTLPL